MLKIIFMKIRWTNNPIWLFVIELQDDWWGRLRYVKLSSIQGHCVYMWRIQYRSVIEKPIWKQPLLSSVDSRWSHPCKNLTIFHHFTARRASWLFLLLSSVDNSWCVSWPLLLLYLHIQKSYNYTSYHR